MPGSQNSERRGPVNPLFNMLGNTQYGNMAGLVSQFQKFRQNFQGDPQKQIQELLNSGRITQDQYNSAVQKAKALQKIMGV